MQEINELKNLVIQSLEGNGVLGQIRAQIRASVFKIIEMQETSTKKNAGFYWENPLCQTIYDNKEGKVALELINDFLEFFKMDYTSSIFTHESNLKDAAKREELQKRLGLKQDANKPVLFQIINSLSGEGSSHSPNKENLTTTTASKETTATKIGASTTKPAGAAKNITTDFQEADLGKKNFDNFGKNKKAGFPNFEEPQEEKASTGLSRGGGKLPPLSSLSPQDKFGTGTKQPEKPADEPKKQAEDFKKPGDYYKDSGDKFKSAQHHDSEDEYENEAFENVDEELVEDLEDEDPKSKDKKAMLTSSEDIIGASQSQGFDVSVDSLALEEYDYFENAERPR